MGQWLTSTVFHQYKQYLRFYKMYQLMVIQLQLQTQAVWESKISTTQTMLVIIYLTLSNHFPLQAFLASILIVQTVKTKLSQTALLQQIAVLFLLLIIPPVRIIKIVCPIHWILIVVRALILLLSKIAQIRVV